MSITPQVDPTVVNQAVTTAEGSYTLPDNCRQFQMQCRTAVDVRWAFETGYVAGPTAPYLTLKSGTVYSSPEKLAASGKTLYFAAGSSVVVELLIWAGP